MATSGLLQLQEHVLHLQMDLFRVICSEVPLGTENAGTDLQLKFEGVDTNDNKASSKSIPTKNAGSELDEDEGMTEQWEKSNNFGSLSTLSSFAPKLPGVYSDSSIEYEFTNKDNSTLYRSTANKTEFTNAAFYNFRPKLYSCTTIM